jgi:hypothetical protein
MSYEDDHDDCDHRSSNFTLRLCPVILIIDFQYQQETTDIVKDHTINVSYLSRWLKSPVIYAMLLLTSDEPDQGSYPDELSYMNTYLKKSTNQRA